MRPICFYVGVFLVSFAALMLEIVQTRILSVVVWYHLAFLVISLAMFGLTAGAVWVYLKGERFTENTLSYDLGYFSGLFALATAICLAVQMTLAPIITRFFTTLWVWTELALCLSIPVFLRRRHDQPRSDARSSSDRSRVWRRLARRGLRRCRSVVAAECNGWAFGRTLHSGHCSGRGHLIFIFRHRRSARNQAAAACVALESSVGLSFSCSGCSHQSLSGARASAHRRKGNIRVSRIP